jgi:hypothetical protein
MRNDDIHDNDINDDDYYDKDEFKLGLVSTRTIEIYKNYERSACKYVGVKSIADIRNDKILKRMVIKMYKQNLAPSYIKQIVRYVCRINRIEYRDSLTSDDSIKSSSTKRRQQLGRQQRWRDSHRLSQQCQKKIIKMGNSRINIEEGNKIIDYCIQVIDNDWIVHGITYFTSVFILLSLYTGLRPHEIMQLNRRHIDAWINYSTVVGNTHYIDIDIHFKGSNSHRNVVGCHTNGISLLRRMYHNLPTRMNNIQYYPIHTNTTSTTTTRDVLIIQYTYQAILVELKQMYMCVLKKKMPLYSGLQFCRRLLDKRENCSTTTLSTSTLSSRNDNINKTSKSSDGIPMFIINN